MINTFKDLMKHLVKGKIASPKDYDSIVIIKDNEIIDKSTNYKSIFIKDFWEEYKEKEIDNWYFSKEKGFKPFVLNVVLKGD